MILVSITRYIYSSNIVFSSQNYAAGYSGSSHCERKIKIKVIILIMGNLKKKSLKPKNDNATVFNMSQHCNIKITFCTNEGSSPVGKILTYTTIGKS